MCQRKAMATYIRGEMEEWMKETKREGETAETELSEMSILELGAHSRSEKP